MIPFLIKSAISLAVLLLVYKLFLEKEKMHRFNRFYLLFSLLFSFSLPFVNIPIYVKTEGIEQIAATADDSETLSDKETGSALQQIVWQDGNNDTNSKLSATETAYY